MTSAVRCFLANLRRRYPGDAGRVFHHLVRQVTLDVARQAVGRLITPRAIFLKRLHHHPVELTPDHPSQLGRLGLAVSGHARQCLERAQSLARRGCLFLTNQPADLLTRGMREPPSLERCRAGQQLVKQHAQRVNVGPRVDIEAAHLRLLGAHVQRRTDHLGQLSVDRAVRQLLVDRLGDAEVDHLHHRLAVERRHQHIRRFHVAVNDSFLMGMLDRATDIDEELETLARVSWFLSQYSVIGMPRTSSMTK